jgi:hypothetical protein
MKHKFQLSKIVISAALLFALGVLPARAQSASEIQIVAGEIQKLVPAIRAIKNESERDFTLDSMALVLALLGKLEAAQQINGAISDRAAQQKTVT